MTNGLVVMTPSSIDYSGTSASINADGSVVFSGVSPLSLNGVFTSDYDNYMVAMRYSTSANNGELFFRVRSSGTDNSTASSYTQQLIAAANDGIFGSRVAENYGRVGYLGNEQRLGMNIYIFGPYLAQPTAWRSVTVHDLGGGAIFEYANTHNQSTSYDGFSLICQSGNFSGLMTVFGFNQ